MKSDRKRRRKTEPALKRFMREGKAILEKRQTHLLFQQAIQFIIPPLTSETLPEQKRA
jgi:hypothetical protein